jgi:hypothetical protein
VRIRTLGRVDSNRRRRPICQALNLAILQGDAKALTAV